MLDRRQALKAAALAGLALAGGGARAAAAPAVVALSEQRSRFLAAVEVNGDAGHRFVFDTGATTHFISTRLAQSLGLPVVEERFVRGHDGRRRDSVVDIARLAVGGVDVGRVRAVAWDPGRMDQHDGLIGYPFLYPRAVVALGEARIGLGEAPAVPLTPVRARVMRNQALLLGGLPGEEGRFLFDTGAQSCTLTPSYYARIARTEAYRSAVKLVYRDADGETRTAAFRAAEISFGDFRIPDAIVRVGEADGREGVFEGLDGLFGVNLMRAYTWAIDQAAGRIQAGGAAPARVGWFGAGMRIGVAGGLVRVTGVQDGGPAFEAGVRAGQPVVSLFGEPPDRWTPAFLADASPGDRPGPVAVEVLDRGVRRLAAFDTVELL